MKIVGIVNRSDHKIWSTEAGSESFMVIFVWSCIKWVYPMGQDYVRYVCTPGCEWSFFRYSPDLWSWTSVYVVYIFHIFLLPGLSSLITLNNQGETNLSCAKTWNKCSISRRQLKNSRIKQILKDFVAQMFLEANWRYRQRASLLLWSMQKHRQSWPLNSSQVSALVSWLRNSTFQFSTLTKKTTSFSPSPTPAGGVKRITGWDKSNLLETEMR